MCEGVGVKLIGESFVKSNIYFIFLIFSVCVNMLFCGNVW